MADFRDLGYAQVSEVFFFAQSVGDKRAMCSTSCDPNVTLQRATVVSNRCVCRAHYSIVLHMPSFPDSLPGQFVHIRPEPHATDETSLGHSGASGPVMLRRAFSIAGHGRAGGGNELELLYRVVGKGTAALSDLGVGDTVSVLGPLGNAFPIHEDKTHALMVGGGVGLPPMMYLAGALVDRGRQAVAFCGAASADLLALEGRFDEVPDPTARTARLCAEPFARWAVPVVVSTDDGSLGFHGYIDAALQAYLEASNVDPKDTVVYTCGPELMMQSVSRRCAQQGMACYVCMERVMGCGMGTCQSCVVRVSDDSDPDGWRYRLCCADGPVFASDQVVWG